MAECRVEAAGIFVVSSTGCKVVIPGSKLKVDKYPPEVFIVFFHTVIQLFDVSLIQKAQDFFLELTAAFTGDDVNKVDWLFEGLLHNAI